MVYEMKETKKLAPLFENWQETLIWSCLDGSMGKAFVTDCDTPKSARIITADFSFFAGRAERELVAFRPSQVTGTVSILVPENWKWERIIEEIYGSEAEKITRYATKKEPDVFDREYLESLARGLTDKQYEIKKIDRALYNRILSQEWSRDLCAQFRVYKDYERRGLGFAALWNGQTVAGASSYTVYRGGIEIEIDTREDFRRRGLAAACSARLITECLDRGIYPSWDAHTPVSLALARKLGYSFDKAYTAYQITGG